MFTYILSSVRSIVYLQGASHEIVCPPVQSNFACDKQQKRIRFDLFFYLTALGTAFAAETNVVDISGAEANLVDIFGAETYLVDIFGAETYLVDSFWG